MSGGERLGPAIAAHLRAQRRPLAYLAELCECSPPALHRRVVDGILSVRWAILERGLRKLGLAPTELDALWILDCLDHGQIPIPVEATPEQVRAALGALRA